MNPFVSAWSLYFHLSQRGRRCASATWHARRPRRRTARLFRELLEDRTLLASYTVVDLATLGGTKSDADAINDLGQVVGTSNLAGDSTSDAFLYSNGNMSDIVAGDLYDDETPESINASGQVVGNYTHHFGIQGEGFFYSSGITKDVGELLNATVYGNSAEGINDAGQITGEMRSLTTDANGDTNNEDGYVLSTVTGQVTDISATTDPFAHVTVQPTCINNLGDVGGSVYNADGNTYAGFVYSSGHITYLPTAIVGVRGINDAGEIVGGTSDGSGACLYSGGSLTDLGTLPGKTASDVLGLNDSGIVVGDSYNDDASTADEILSRRAFVYSGGVMEDLNSLIPSDSGWLLNTATAINKNGAIVGSGINPEGLYHAFLLEPAPTTSAPNISAGALTWDASDDGAQYAYAIANSDLPQAATIEAFWASGRSNGTSTANVIGAPVYVSSTATAVGTYSGNTIPPEDVADVPAGATHLLLVFNRGGAVRESDNTDDAISLPLADLQAGAQSLTFDTAQPSVDYNYTVAGAPTTQATTAAFYWATGSTIDTTLGSDGSVWPASLAEPAYTLTIPRGTAVGSHPGQLPNSAFGTPPKGALELVMILNPPTSSDPLGPGSMLEADATNNLTALALPDISMTYFAWNDDRDGTAANNHRGIDMGYSVQNADLSLATTVTFYWSATTDLTKQHAIVQDRSPYTSPSSFSLAQQVGAYGRQTFASPYLAAYNDPAEWRAKPDWADYLLAVADPEANELLAYPESSVSYRSETTLPLGQLSTPAQILSSAVQRPIVNGLNIQTTFNPGAGLAISMSEAEVTLGIDHFNWLQTITTPSTMIPVTFKNLNPPPNEVGNLLRVTGQGFSYVVNNNGSLSFVPAANVTATSHPSPFYDPIVPYNDGLYGNTYVRGFLVDGGQYAYYWHLSGTDSPLPDGYYFLSNEPNPKDTQQFPNVIAMTTDVSLGFEDAPNQLYAANPPFDPSTIIDPFAGNTSLSFRTELVGVLDNSAPGHYLSWANSGYKTSFNWKSNGQSPWGGGGAAFFGWGIHGPIDPTTPGLAGGVFDVQLSDQSVSVPALQLSAIPNQEAHAGTPLRISTGAVDALEGAEITYSLNPGAPSGASIDPTTGVFTWTPENGPEIATITVRATDNATPPNTASQTFTATVAGSGIPHQQYVMAVYEDVLGRTPDSSSFSFWSQQLDSGMPASSVAQAIGHSAEYFANFVVKPDYLKLLGRAADDAGVQFWTTQMQTGLTDQDLEAQFAASDEFFHNAGGETSAVNWIDAVYKLLLGRTADPGGETYWSAKLASLASTGSGQNSRYQVAIGIAGSQENNTNLINEDYFHYLGRVADPDGLTYWLQRFADGAANEDVIADFTGSAEYYKEHTTT